jgi:hypothetical protein
MLDDIESVGVHVKILEPEECQRDAVVNNSDIRLFGTADESQGHSALQEDS